MSLNYEPTRDLLESVTDKALLETFKLLAHSSYVILRVRLYLAQFF